MAAPLDLAEVRELLGKELRTHPNNNEATLLAIMLFIKGIGDRNPIYKDEGYARRSVHGGLIAPPCWLYTVHDTVIAPKLAGQHVLYGGADWEFFRTIHVGDRIKPTSRLVAVEERASRLAGRSVVQVLEVTYTNQFNQTVATCKSRLYRIDRDEAVKRGKYADFKRYRYSREEALGIEDGYDAEVIRGDEPRYWEETVQGDELAPVVKGPLTEEDMLQFVQATRPLPIFKDFLALRARHPEVAFRHPDTNAWANWAAGLLEDKVSEMYGFPYAHDMGIDRISWLGNLMTNWMGDSGHLRRLNVDLILPNLHGDTQWCKGKVKGKRQEGGQALVDVEIWCESQRGQITARGVATVALPTLTIG